MERGLIPINRVSIGCIAIGCWLLAGLIWWAGWESQGALWQGALSRVGVVMAAFWIAMPTRTREAAWARVSWKWVLGGLVALIVIGRSRVPLRFLIPALIVTAVVVLILRPRPKHRPQSR